MVDQKDNELTSVHSCVHNYDDNRGVTRYSGKILYYSPPIDGHVRQCDGRYEATYPLTLGDNEVAARVNVLDV